MTTQSKLEPVKFLADSTRFKLSLDDEGKVSCFWNHRELDGRWVALVAAEDGCHLSLTSSKLANPLTDDAGKGKTSQAIFSLMQTALEKCAKSSDWATRDLAKAAIKEVADKTSPIGCVQHDCSECRRRVADQSEAQNLLQDIAAYIGVGGYNGATTAQLADRIRAEFDRLSAPKSKDDLGALLEGMEVSVDVSTDEHDAQNRYFGKVTEVMEDSGCKNGAILLVQEPNFTVVKASVGQSDIRCEKCHTPNSCGADGKCLEAYITARIAAKDRTSQD